MVDKSWREVYITASRTNHQVVFCFTDSFDFLNYRLLMKFPLFACLKFSTKASNPA